MAGVNCCAFSESGKYFAACGEDGKLKVWETETGILNQEYTPNLHLSSPYSCLTWIVSRNSPLPNKKKRRKSNESGNETEALALGTTSGEVKLYSVASSSIVGELGGGHNYVVNHIAWTRGCNLFSCDAQHIVEWNVDERKVKSKWKTSGEHLTCLLVLPDGNSLLAAGNTIGLWDVPNKKLIRRYTGHSSEVTSLTLVPGGETYFISAAKNDRLLCAWSLNSANQDKNSVASFVMEDVATCVSVFNAGITVMLVVSRSGILHIYKHQLNGKCEKPLKPKVTVQIASDSNQSKETVQPIPIIGAHSQGEKILICHGTSVFLTFETISPNYEEKLMFLIRQDPRKSVSSKDADLSKVKQPETGDNVEYISSVGAVVGISRKSKKVNSINVPMEKQLDNLSLTRQEDVANELPSADNMSQLLMQGLYSEDKTILKSVLVRRNPGLITNTVMRLPVQCVVPLLKELVSYMHLRTLWNQIAVVWLKAVMRIHAGHLLANPEVKEILAPVLGLIETRLNLLAPLSKLRGRLDLLVDQITETNKKDNVTQELGESLLVYHDEDPEDGSGLEDAALGSESEDHWEELSDMDADDNDDDVEDVNMSS